MNSRLASLTKIRNSIFEDRGHIHSLLKEWYSLRNRFTAQDLIADEASVEGDPEPSAKRARISTSSSTPATTVDDNNTRVEELDTTTTQVSSLDAAERVGESSATPQPKPDKLTDIEDTLLKSFIPTEHMDLVIKGMFLLGFRTTTHLTLLKNPRIKSMNRSLAATFSPSSMFYTFTRWRVTRVEFGISNSPIRNQINLPFRG